MEPTERTWGVTPVPDRLRTLSGLDVGLLWGNLGISLLVLFTGTFLAGLGLQRALLAAIVGAVLGSALLGLAGLIGFDRRVPGMVLLRDPLGERGSYAPTALNVAPEPRLGGLRALRHVAGGECARRPGLRLRGALALGARLRRADRCGSRWPGRSRSSAAGCAASPSGWWRPRRRTWSGGRSTAPTSGALWSADGRGRDALLPGRRPDRGDGRLLAPAGGRLHALLPQQAGGVLGDVGRLLRPARPPLRAGRAARPLARAGRSCRDLHRDRGRRGRERRRAARADRGRDGRAVRQRLLGRRLDPEPLPGRLARAPRRARSPPWPPSAPSSWTSSPTRPSSSCSAPSSSRSSACWRRTSCSERPRRWRCAGAASSPGWPASPSTSGSSRPGPEWWTELLADVPGAGEVTTGASLPAFGLAFALYAGVRSAHAPLGRRRARYAGSR